MALVGLLAISPFRLARADTLDPADALDLITETADKICAKLQLNGSSTSEEAKVEINAQLKGLARVFAGGGVSGAGSITNDEYQGVLRQDLASTLQNIQLCRQHIFDSLETKLIPSNPSPPPPPSSIGKKIRICPVNPDPETGYAISIDGTPANVFGWVLGTKCRTLNVSNNSLSVYVVAMAKFNDRWSDVTQTTQSRSLPICVRGKSGSDGLYQYDKLSGFAVSDNITKHDCDDSMEVADYHKISIGGSNEFAYIELVP